MPPKVGVQTMPLSGGKNSSNARSLATVIQAELNYHATRLLAWLEKSTRFTMETWHWASERHMRSRSRSGSKRLVLPHPPATLLRASAPVVEKAGMRYVRGHRFRTGHRMADSRFADPA